jgi:hypothetical protein
MQGFLFWLVCSELKVQRFVFSILSPFMSGMCLGERNSRPAYFLFVSLSLINILIILWGGVESPVYSCQQNLYSAYRYPP